MSELANHVQHNRQHHAQQDRGSQGEVEGGVLTAINEISWEAPKRQMGAAEQNERDAGDEHDRAQKNQQSSQIGHSSF